MNVEEIIPLVSMVVTWIMGELSKKFNWYESKYIPIQNLLIGIVATIVYILANDEANITAAIVTVFSGLLAGGIYDLAKTSNKTTQSKNKKA